MNKRHNIALIGCGGIVNYGSLVAYQKHGLQANIVGCYDINPAAALETAEKWHMPQVYNSIYEIAEDKTVDIVEIAVTPWDQPDIAYQMAKAGKHLLCQKPLCDNLKTAKSLVKVVNNFGVKLAVNQQFRWSPMIMKLVEILPTLGDIKDVTLRVRANTPWMMWPWLIKQSRLEIMYHSIHYLDAMRKLFGEPYTVTSLHQYSDARVAGESKTITVLNYIDKKYNGFQVLLDVHHHPSISMPEAVIDIQGTNGIATGAIGTMYDYPNGRNDTLSVRYGNESSISFRLSGKWIPDAFIGPISNLMQAIDSDTEPETSGKDNLKTLDLVERCYASAASGKTVFINYADGDWAKLNK